MPAADARLIGGVALMMAIACPPAWTHPAVAATNATSASTDCAAPFNIPSQPLDDALRAYAGATQRPAIFRSALVAGRISAPVSGCHTAHRALQLLLVGTGLEVDEVATQGQRAFVLRAAPQTAGVRASDAGTAVFDQDAMLQAAVWRALCSTDATQPGDYRALIRLQFDARGRVAEASLLNSTGSSRRDVSLQQVLRRVRVDWPVPAAASEPWFMLVLPDGDISGRNCAGALQ